MNRDPILITGASRSGSSMIAGVLNVCGAFGGRMAVANSNKRGMFENIRIRDTLIKPYLLRMGGDMNGQYPMPSKVHIPTSWKDDVEQIMMSEGYEDGQWMYKDSRLSLMWQVWHYAYPDAKWVIVRRRTGDIIQSCVKTGFMKAFKDKRNVSAVNATDELGAWLWYVHQFEQRFIEMITEGLNVKIIWPERMVTGDYKQLYELLDWLGLTWKTEALSFIDSLLWGSRPKKETKEMEVIYGNKDNGGRG